MSQANTKPPVTEPSSDGSVHDETCDQDLFSDADDPMHFDEFECAAMQNSQVDQSLDDDNAETADMDICEESHLPDASSSYCYQNLDISTNECVELSELKQSCCPQFFASQEDSQQSQQENTTGRSQADESISKIVHTIIEAEERLHCDSSIEVNEIHHNISSSQIDRSPDTSCMLSSDNVIDICDSQENLEKNIPCCIEQNSSLSTVLLSQDAPEDKAPDDSQHNTTIDSLNEEVLPHGTPSKVHCGHTFVQNPDRMNLLRCLWGTGTGNAKSSTPIKGPPPSFSFSMLSPLPEQDESDVSSEDSASSEEDSPASSSDSEEMDVEDANFSVPELAVSQSFSGNFSLPSISEETNDSVIELHCVSIQPKVQLYNDLKIHNGNDRSVNEAINKIMSLYVKNKLSKAGLQRTISTFCEFLPSDHNIPTSAYVVLEYVKSLAPPVLATVHYYCQSCLYYHVTEATGGCDICNESTFGRFFIFDIAALIKFFFEHCDLASIIDREEKRNRNVPGMRDMKDGSVYQNLNQNRGKYDINIIFNADGVRIRKGSTKDLWLAMFTIVELPTHLQKSFVTILGVWYDSMIPVMSIFLKPFAEAMEMLDKNGVHWTHPFTKEKHVSLVRLPVVVEDAPARAITQNVLHFNGCYGCSLCELKATKMQVPQGSKKKRIRKFHYVHDPQLRTKERMFRQAESVGNKEHVKGVKGPSVLSCIPSVDISKCMVPEYLHSVLLGTCKRLLEIWTSKSGDWSIKCVIRDIDLFLKSIKHPSFVHRRIRQLKSLSYWKASDFYYFLLFESLPALCNYLPDLYFQHFTLLVQGIFKLNKMCVLESDIYEADMLLRIFVLDYEKLYGERELTYNLHQLLHLATCVRWYGPLHCWSAFNYEDLNGMVAKTTHGTNHVDVEIINNIKICQGIHMLKSIVENPEDTAESIDMSSTILLVGRTVADMELPAEELQMLNDDCPTLYERAILGYDSFTSELYKCLRSENFHVMWTENENVRYGSIKYFAQTRDDKFVVISVLHVDHTIVFYNRDTLKTVEHFVPVERTQSSVAIKLKDIVSSIVKIGRIGSYVYKRPNLFRYVL